MGGQRTRRNGWLRLRRIITQVIVFLLLLSGGAVVNVAVAWIGAAAGSWWQTGPQGDMETEARWWARWSPPGFPSSPYSALTMHEFAAENTVFSAIETPAGKLVGARRTRAGWPLLGLEGCLWYRDPPFGPVVMQDLLCFPNRFVLGQDPAPTVLPTRPLWPGFLINTLFYAIILWLLIPGPFALRRVIRIKRGRCPKCGYDLRGAPPEVGAGGGCPECGWKREVEA
jgi:hypothetical protein